MNSSNRTYRSKPEWQSIVDQHRDSGLSARRFCEDKSINYVSFCNWRSKLTKSDAAVPLIDLSDLMNHPVDHLSVLSLISVAALN
jgi:hypothetical protein